ncbi:aminotransferase class IV [Fluviicola chungangensis]|uniref:branched-chain-amino-acid transaminase n=1 Tax=Fluviicola chungangensis TaxID=2597671 RepID=A0A556N6K9_9FLAO|nr:aminotransferase class IV [Fluviicola chungangensis]TSJ47741.1 4-amino-4-deoxychorismate lyase [Fluviicola chungangensis]
MSDQELFVNNNGKIISNTGPSITAGNRGYTYGDGLFESIRVMNGKAINLSHHFSRLSEGAKVLKMRLPAFYTTEFFQQQVDELIQLCKITEGARIRLSIDRLGGGTYLPDTNEVSYFIEIYPIENNLFSLNSKGLEVDLYQEIRKTKNILSNYKTKNGILYVLAAISAKEKGLDDMLITNDNGQILESSHSNIFVVSNGVLYTPSLSDGCLAGTMRMQVINLALKNGLKVYECPILPSNLLVADEVFLTNAVRGITWVGGYRTKRYFNTTARKIVAFLNEEWDV